MKLFVCRSRLSSFLLCEPFILGDELLDLRHDILPRRDLRLDVPLLGLQLVHLPPRESFTQLDHLVLELLELGERVLLLLEPIELRPDIREFLLFLLDEVVHLTDLFLDVHELVGDLLQQRSLGEEIVLVLCLSAVKELSR